MKKVIVVVGPTGVGKTSLSVEIAKRFDGEIISGDAYQIYKKMDIGTAKVKEEESKGIVHHLVDTLEMDEEYNVKIFQEKGRACIDEIIERGKVPIICGGTGLYIKALLYDYLFQEEEQDTFYLEQLQKLSSEELYEKLQKEDSKACENLHMNNRKRVIRALMMAHSGEKKSERLEKQEHTLLYDAYLIGLTLPRENLYERINERVEIMMKEGLYEEVKGLLEDKKSFTLQSMRAIGYKEWEEHFLKESSIEEVKEKIKKNSRNFAKRQYTWFNHQMDVNWYDASEDREIIYTSCEAFLMEKKSDD